MSTIDEMLHGPVLLGDGRVRFRLWAPSVDTAALRLGGRDTPMRQTGDGWFEVEASAPPGDSYAFVLPGGVVPDPASRAQADGVHGPSLVIDPGSYVWQNAEWRNRPWHEAVIYEVHAGLLGGFDGLVGRLQGLAAMGITALELMPVADFPGQRNWGYDGVLPFAPARSYGTPDQLRALVDAAHGAGLMIFLDVVYNHFGPDGAYLHTYARPFFDESEHTPWGAAIDFKRPEVRAFFVQNALMWINEYRFDGLRFDAVHAISPASFLPDLAAELRAGAHRPVHLVLEHEGNKSTLLCGPEMRLFDAQWADDWHHCVHVLLTGESEGYYEGFQNPATQLARAMAEGFVYQGEISPHHGVPRGEPSSHLPPTAFVTCLQNHDQIGNRAMGERLTQLAHPQALAAATALLLLSPQIPLLFMGEEEGVRTPFLFFTDHNEELAKLVREGRRREFAHFAAFQDEALREMIPDPNAPATFAASVPTTDGADFGVVREMHRQLLAIRHAHIMPGIPGCRTVGARALNAHAVCASWQLGNGRTLTLASNFGVVPVVFGRPEGELVFATVPDDGTPDLPPRCTLAFLGADMAAAP